jgi:alkylhydroperoxidase/carboxymuconolactone decarboxylase family protein YurZ
LSVAERPGALNEPTMSKPEHIADTEAYVESIFGSGTGEAHVRFLERIQNPALREMIHRYHTLEADTSELSLHENYLIGMSVLLAQRDFSTAAFFAKTLLHLGMRKEKILEACARLAMWIGGLPATEASFVIQRAIREYEREGVASLGAWFPPEPRP